MSNAMPSPSLGMQDLRCTLECAGSALSVVRVEERRSLARPPELVLDVVVGDSPASLVREPAGLLVEDGRGSRYVQGWVRGVERYGDARLGTRLRVLLVPTTLLADAGAQAGEESAEPAYVYDPEAWAVAVAAEVPTVTQEPQRPAKPSPQPSAAALPWDGDEDAETSTHRFSHEELRALRRGSSPAEPEPFEPERTIVLDTEEPDGPRVTGGGTELLSRSEVLRMLAGGSPPQDAASPSPAQTQERTERVPMDHVAKLASSVPGGLARMQQAAEPSSPRDPPGTNVSAPGEQPPRPAGPSERDDGTRHWAPEDLAELRRRWEAKHKGG